MSKRNRVFSLQYITQCKGLLLTTEQGFALPIALALGIVMITLGAATILLSQQDRSISVQRTEMGVSLASTEGGTARLLAQLTQAHNSILLGRNYDTINPATGKTYLGPDGIPGTGDEEAAVIDEWTNYNPSGAPCFQQKSWAAPNVDRTGTIGNGTFNLRAYRYNPVQQQGTLLVENSLEGRTSAVLVTFAIHPDLDDFPSIIVSDPSNGANTRRPGVLALRGRHIIGDKGNVYYVPSSSADPTLSSYSAPGESTRPDYLRAIWSSTSDGALGDTVSGRLFACSLSLGIPPRSLGTNLGTINTSTTLTGTGGQTPTIFQVEQINLKNNDVLTVDTTNGPVHLDFVRNGYNAQALTLRDNAKILNVRTDGQSPQVGDLRIQAWDDKPITLTGQTCIQNAFLYFRLDVMKLSTSGPGCPGGKNTNVEGVVWIEALLSSKNAASNSNVSYLGWEGTPIDTTVIPGVTSGLYVPDDVSSLTDLLPAINWPARYRFGAVLNWQRIKL
jgi:hypothetical protein